MCPNVELHAFILGDQLPQRRIPGIQYHLLAPSPDFSHPLREVYFRRMEVLDDLGVDYAMTVDSFDVLCLQPLPPFEQMLGNADVGACVEHQGGRYVLGQGYTSSFLNGGVFLWNVPRSRDIRAEIVARGRTHFRTLADDQFCLNEVIQTKYFDRLRILPCQYNYRAYLKGTLFKKPARLANGGTSRWRDDLSQCHLHPGGKKIAAFQIARHTSAAAGGRAAADSARAILAAVAEQVQTVGGWVSRRASCNARTRAPKICSQSTPGATLFLSMWVARVGIGAQSVRRWP